MKLLLSWPVSPVHFNQMFGVNGDYYRSNGINIDGHNGIDMRAGHGQPVYAAHDGTAYYEVDGDSGEGVVLRTFDEYDFNGTQRYFKTIYWHLCNPKREPQFASPIYGNPMGVKVKRGDLIGYADSTGLSTGDHLHFGLKPQYYESDGLWYNDFPQNGYLGAIDPLPYLPVFVEYPMNLGFGSTGSDVLLLQKYLVSEHYGSYTPTGFFGPKTAASVVAFQRAHGIPQTGIVGPITRSVLDAIAALYI